jgi:ADP-ribosyl-[dinitrogen reductase] hydrolase
MLVSNLRSEMPPVRTSLSHPLHIASLPVGARGGRIGVTFAPGKKQAVAMTGSWNRDLDLDLRAIRDWGACTLVTLLEPFEFDELEVASLPERASTHGLEWIGLPITDGAAPDTRFLVPWSQTGPELVRALHEGRSVVFHCKGGLGRAGTAASILLLDSGAAQSADEAMSRVRSVRPGAVETSEQEKFIRDWNVA